MVWDDSCHSSSLFLIRNCHHFDCQWLTLFLNHWWDMPYLYLTVVNHDVFVWLQKTNMTKSDAPLAAIIAKMGILQSKLFYCWIRWHCSCLAFISFHTWGISFWNYRGLPKSAYSSFVGQPWWSCRLLRPLPWLTEALDFLKSISA